MPSKPEERQLSIAEQDQKYLDDVEAPVNREIWSERKPGQTILDFVHNPGRVFEVSGMTSDKREIVIKESCDGAFSLTFNKAQLAELLAALQALHDQMKD